MRDLFETRNNPFCTDEQRNFYENKWNEIYNSAVKEIARLENELYKITGVPKEKVNRTPNEKNKPRKKL